MWPEDNAGDAAAARADGDRSWRLRPEDVARRFAAHILGWNDPGLRHEAGTVFVITDGRDRRRAVAVTMVQVVGPLWSVGSVRGVGAFADYGPAIAKHGGVIEILGLEAEHRAVSVEAYAHLGSLHARALADDDGSVTLRLGDAPAVAGHVLILWRDRDGEVVSAFATPVPAGDTAAG